MIYNAPVGGAANDPYVTGVPGVTPGSIPPGGAIEQPQREIASVIIATGQTPDAGDLGQLAKGIQSGKMNSAANTGSADAIVAAFSPAITSLVDGLELEIRCPNSNTISVPALTPNNGTIPAYPIMKGNNIELVPGDIPLRAKFKWDATLTKWVLVNPFVQAATKSDQVTSTSLTKYVSPGTQQHHPSAVKCWANIHGPTSTVTQGYNFDGVTYIGTGVYSCNISVDFANADYVALAQCADTTSSSGASNINANVPMSDKLVGNYLIHCREMGSLALTNVGYLSTIAMGAQ